MYKSVLISNNLGFHFEIIESVIMNINKILETNEEKFNIYINCSKVDTFFNKYIEKKFPDIILKKINNYDYIIHCTKYDTDFLSLSKEIESNTKYICHEYTERLKENPNTWFLTPFGGESKYLKCNYLPFIKNEKIKTDVPIYVIQGNLNHSRRNLKLLIEILNTNFNKDFKIKMLGKGVLPRELNKFKDKIILKNNLNFIDYHKDFLDCYCLLPLITKKSHKQYYNNKLTSSINYILGYKLKTLIDDDLQKIYNLPDAEVFNNKDDICEKFQKTLDDFYKTNK